MRLHRRHDHAFGQLEEALVERALEDDRALDEMHDLVQDAGGVAPLAEPIEALRDLAQALCPIRLDARLAQRLRVRARRRDLDRAVREAVAVRDVAARRNRHVDRLGVEEGADPADGPREAETALVPAHRAGEGEPAHDLLEALRQHLGERLAGNRDAEEPLSRLELRHGDAVAPCKSLRRPLGERLRRAFHPLVGRPLLELVQDEGEPARPCIELVGPPAEMPLTQLRQLRRTLAARPGGQFLAADLKQQLRHRSPGIAGRRGGRGRGRGRCRRPAPSPRSRPARREG